MIIDRQGGAPFLFILSLMDNPERSGYSNVMRKTISEIGTAR